MLSSDLILQQILEQSQKENDNLLEIKKAIVDSRPGGGGGGGGGGPGPGPNPPPGQRSIFDKLKDVLDKSGASGHLRNSAGSLLNNNMNGAQNAVRGFGGAIQAAGSVLGMLPGPVGKAAQALTQLAAAGIAAYEWLDGQHKLYIDINESGVALQNGFITLRKGAATSLLSVDQLSKVIKTNSTAFSSMNDMYGDGVTHFSTLMNSVQGATNAAGIYGLSQDTLADITAKNYKMQKLYGMNSQMQDANSTASTVKFIDQLNTMSKVMGTSIDALVKKVDGFMTGSRGIGLQATFEMMNGITREMAGKMAQGLSTGLSAMGEAGKDVQNAYADFVNTGIVDINQWGAASSTMTEMFRSFQQLGTGISDPKEVQRVMDSYTKGESNRLRLQQLMVTASRSGTQQQQQMIANLITYSQLASTANETSAKAASGWDGMISRFNKWMGDMWTPISHFFDDTLDGIGNWLIGIADASANPMQFISNMFESMWVSINNSMSYVIGLILDIPKFLISIFVGDKIEEEMKAGTMKAFDALLDLPRLLLNAFRDLLFGSSKQVDESVGAIKAGVSNFFGGIYDNVAALFSFDAGIDGVKKNIETAWNSMKSKLTDFWDTLSSWFGRSENDPAPAAKAPPTPASSPVNASTNPKKQPQDPKGSNNKPSPGVQVQEPEANDDAKDPVVDTGATIDDLLRALNKLAQGSGKTNDALNSLSAYLRTIASNTAPERNV